MVAAVTTVGMISLFFFSFPASHSSHPIASLVVGGGVYLVKRLE